VEDTDTPSSFDQNTPRPTTELLNRWIADERAEGVWQAIQTQVPDLTPETLIKQVISA
jgi:hypothetical protein